MDKKNHSCCVDLRTKKFPPFFARISCRVIGELRILKNVFSVFDSIERHLMKIWFAFVFEQNCAGDGQRTEKDKVFV